jgi:4-nitrophenyl phosphatase
MKPVMNITGQQEILAKIKCFVMDLDGTVYLGKKILDGAIEFLHMLEKNKIKIKFFTNNSSKNTKIYVDRIRSMGYHVEDDMMLISNHVIINYLKKYAAEKTVFVLGNEYLQNDFKEAGILLVDENPDIVVVGFDTSLAYDNLTKACTFVRNGAKFLAVNPDFNCPIEGGYIPDCGSICALITASTGVKPEYFGKPTAHTLQYILENTGCKEEEIAIVGDRLYTDIALGKGNDVTTILVLSGESQLGDITESEVKPTLVFPSLKQLKEALEGTG